MACGMPKTTNASAEDFYRALAARYAGKLNAGPSKGFGSNALKVNDKIFASLTKGRLLLKLPEARVDALVKSKKATRFSTGVGRVKKEWVTVGPSTESEWLTLAEEARAYVSANNPTSAFSPPPSAFPPPAARNKSGCRRRRRA